MGKHAFALDTRVLHCVARSASELGPRNVAQKESRAVPRAARPKIKRYRKARPALNQCGILQA